MEVNKLYEKTQEELNALNDTLIESKKSLKENKK